MWHWLGKIPVYQARRCALIYFNAVVWFVLIVVLGLAAVII